ncbi:FAD-dependent oxidoreductase [Desulfatitalea tepidiphila]|uniref:FAD-dependent oxidoreductase n=1 Tax=Desulfatitalea tepidiphila TaxID=1185843 RepID=UPI000B05A985|nr:FAD-dependent oxidoreductase [Desulfatitalea tepidiphila]
MFEAVLIMLGIGAACGIVLSVASKVFYVWEDPRISQVEYFLSGANCGGCGYAGCSAAANAVVAGKAPPSVCIVAGAEAAIEIAAIMGVDPGTAEPLRSLNSCLGGHRAADKYYYDGAQTCAALANLHGGRRVCSVGCLGMGDCIRSCKFDAIHMGPDGYPVVDEAKCVGCGACEKACPKSILTVRTMSQRLLHFNELDDALAPCQQTCPAEINIPQYIDCIRKGDYAGAVNTIRERNPLLLTCGRVCPHPCEDYCRRGIEDEPVSINQLKRFVADWEMNSGKRLPIPCAPDTGKKVAVIGGGPAGVSCAYFLRRLGHSVNIFEAMPKLGGITRYGIPEYRLPDKVLDWEIQGILDLGIEAYTNHILGRDFTIQSLREEGYDAIFMGIGAWKDYAIGVPGEDMEGCWKGIEFLSKVAGSPDKKIPVGKRAAVVGGGNSAIDCVRTLKRLGCEEVYIVYRRTRKEMPANEVEIVAAEHEGVKFQFLAAPKRVVGDDQGRVTGLEYLRMELGEPDASGRRRPVPVEGSETILPIDMLISAIGQQPELDFLEKEPEKEQLTITRWNTFDNDPELLQTSLPDVFTGGDAATGPSLVVDAIGGGRRAARSIHQYLTGEEIHTSPKSLRKKHIPESLFKTVSGVETKKRTPMPELPVKERIDSMIEVDLVISEQDAAHEAGRCLHCCRICYDPEKSINAA